VGEDEGRFKGASMEVGKAADLDETVATTDDNDAEETALLDDVEAVADVVVTESVDDVCNWPCQRFNQEKSKRRNQPELL
jgi:hypothetical protein